MAWDKPDDKTVTFECDDCTEVVDCDIETIRATGQPTPNDSDFIVCWRYLVGIGWRSFKRTGRNWSYHCVKCGPAAEASHNAHRRQESERDRIKARHEASSD